MSENFLSRLRNFYAHYAPEKIHTIPSLVQHFPDEEKLMKILRDKYGQEPAPLRGASFSPKASPMNNNRSLPQSSIAATTPTPPPPPPQGLSSDFLLPLILQHLRVCKYDGAVESLLAECRLLELPVDAPSAVFDHGSHGESVLGSLVGATPGTRHVLSVLLEAIPERLAEHLPRPFDEATMDALIAMSCAPMWGVVHLGPSGALRAADVNAIVERCTDVVIHPHVTVSAAKIDEDTAFVNAVLRWHRHFVHPYVLLAKLIQRSMVPLSLPVHDTYRGYGIHIENRGAPNARAKYHAQISHTIGVRVLSIIYVWLTYFPMDWTDVMVQCTLLYLEDHGAHSAAHMQFTEGIKLAMADLDERCNAIPFTSCYRVNPNYRRGANIPVVATAPPPEDFPTSLLLVDPIRVARQLTAADHVRFRAIHPAELMAHIVRCNTLKDVTGPNPASRLQEVLDDFAKLFYFTLHEIIGELDVKGRVSKMAYFATLMYSLIECNNLQSAFAVSLAFRHASLTRMRTTNALFKKDHPGHEKAVHHFYHHVAHSLTAYKKYVENIKDTATFPVVPVIGSLVREFRFIEFAEPVALADSGAFVVHWRKFAVMEEMVLALEKIQKVYVPHELQPMPHFQFWLTTLLSEVSQSDDELHMMSCRVEP